VGVVLFEVVRVGVCVCVCVGVHRGVAVGVPVTPGVDVLVTVGVLRRLPPPMLTRSITFLFVATNIFIYKSYYTSSYYDPADGEGVGYVVTVTVLVGVCVVVLDAVGVCVGVLVLVGVCVLVGVGV